MIVSHAKQLLHNLKMNDIRGYQAMMFSTLTAGLAYMAQQQIQMIGLSEKEKRKRREEKLTPLEIAKAAFARSSYAAFIPGAVDSVLDFYGPDTAMFSYRSSGLDSNFVTGNPSYQIVFGHLGIENTLKSLTRAGLNPDIQMTKGRARSLATIFPLSNAIGIQNAIKIATEDLPERSRPN